MFVDTSGFLCCLDSAEARHARAQALYRAAPPKLTHSYVLAELLPLSEARRLRRSETLSYLQSLVASPQVEIVWVDEALHALAMQLLLARPDKQYSLCDAVSFVLMKGRGVYEALTSDHHFEQEGFVRLLPRSQAS